MPISEGYIPNVYVQVYLVGAAVRTDDEGKPNERVPKRPAFARGSLDLSVPPLSRKLSVKATPRDKTLEPGGETSIDVEVRDAAGKPVSGSELAVVVVDEAILGLTGYRIGDPLSTFYSERSPDTSDYHLRSEVILGNPADLTAAASNGRNFESLALDSLRQGQAGKESRFMMAAQAAPPPPPKPGEPESIRTRENFNDLATFSPAVPTDSNGRARVQVKLPDNLTRYRVMAVAVAGGKQFGGGESAITARLPLMVRPSAPRFLNFGDKFELPVVVQNQTDSPVGTKSQCAPRMPNDRRRAVVSRCLQ